MKKTYAILSSLLCITLLLTNCSQKLEEIKLSDLKTVCDYVDAIENIFDEIIEISSKESSISKDDKEQIKSLMNKLEDINEAGGRKYTKKEMMECEGFNRIKEKAKKNADIVRNLTENEDSQTYADSVRVE